MAAPHRVAANVSHLAAIAEKTDHFTRLCFLIVSAFTLLMVLLTFLIVVLRYGFDLGWIAMQESVMYLHALVFTVGIAYTWRTDGHVRVDVFYRRWSARRQALVNLIGNIVLLFPVCVAIIAISWPYVSESWRLLEQSQEAGGLPLVFLLKSLIPLFAGLLLLQGVADSLRLTLSLMNHTEEVR